jgi:hypothetical protein
MRTAAREASIMIDSSKIGEHMEVVGADGKHVGRVDHVEDRAIELSRFDIQARGRHHLIPLSWVEYVDEKVHLGLDRDEAERRWSELH